MADHDDPFGFEENVRRGWMRKVGDKYEMTPSGAAAVEKMATQHWRDRAVIAEMQLEIAEKALLAIEKNEGLNNTGDTARDALSKIGLIRLDGMKDE